MNPMNPMNPMNAMNTQDSNRQPKTANSVLLSRGDVDEINTLLLDQVTLSQLLVQTLGDREPKHPTDFAELHSRMVWLAYQLWEKGEAVEKICLTSAPMEQINGIA